MFLRQRLAGMRQVGQLAPFDLVLLLVLSNGVQDSMSGGDTSITAGLILAVILVGLNWSVGWLADFCSHLHDEHLGDELHSNEADARIIAVEVFKVLAAVHKEP
jgi:hypothetical protein